MSKSEFKCIKNEYHTNNFVSSPIVSIIITILSDDNTDNANSSIDSCIKSCEYYNKDYNLIIVTEQKLKLTEYYQQLSIQVIEKEKTGLADTINIGIDKSNANYCLIHSINSKMKIDRVKSQINLLQLNNADVLFNNCNTIDTITYNNFLSSNLNISELCFVTHKVKTLGELKFEQYYRAYPYKFAYNCLGEWLSVYGHIKSFEDNYKEQYSTSEIEKIQNLITYKHDGELTCMLTFKNEGIEVLKTVQSIRSMSSNVQILLFNDNSTDNYDYENIAQKYDCKYIESKVSHGTGGSRHHAVLFSETEYFIQFDSHMRFYNKNWDIDVLSFLKNHPNDMLCLNTGVIHKDKDGYYDNEDNTGGKPESIGARLCFDKGKEFDLKWLKKDKSKNLNDNVKIIPCILGASYATSKTHWLDMFGLEGMRYYGFDEIMMSLKTWLMGGNSYEFYKIFIGHIYRSKPPYNSPISEYESNRLRCIDLFIDNIDDNKKLKERLKERLGEEKYDAALLKYNNQEEIEDIKFSFDFKKVRNIEDYIEWNKELAK